MTLPIDQYTGKGGIFAGRGQPLPAWLPEPGMRKNVSLNTIESVYPVNAPDTRTRGSKNVLDVWNSTTYVPSLGKYGSILAWGGGHGDYLGNEVYRYDIETRVWSLFLAPFDIPISYHLGTQANDPADGNGTGTGVSDGLYGEYWSDDTKSATVAGQKCPTHTYANMEWIPGPKVGNTNGWLVIVGNFNFQTHKVDLDNPSAGWSRFGVLLNSTGRTESLAQGCSIFDTTRNKLIGFPFANGPQTYCYALDVPSGTLTTPGQDYLEAYYGCMFHAIADDMYLMMRADQPGTFKVMDGATRSKASPNVTGTPPVTNRPGTVEWIESSRQLVYWDGLGESIFFLSAPANMKTGTWVWTSRPFAGDAPSSPPDWPLYKRLHYVPALGTFFHVSVTNGPVQSWKV